MSEQVAPQPIPGMENPNIHPETVNGIRAPEAHDISMTDAPAQAAPPHHLQHPPTSTTTPTTTTAPSPLPVPTARVPTPVPIPGQQQQQQPTSRAASQHPDPSTTTTTGTTTVGSTAAAAGFTMPSEAVPHGAPVRQYINGKITGVLLEGMKMVAREQPKDPLRVLGEFLLQRSKELEGNDGSS